MSPSHLSQGAIHHLCHKRLAGFFSHAVTEAPVDIRHLQSFDTIVSDICNKVDIIYVKLSLDFSAISGWWRK